MASEIKINRQTKSQFIINLSLADIQGNLSPKNQIGDSYSVNLPGGVYLTSDDLEVTPTLGSSVILCTLSEDKALLVDIGVELKVDVILTRSAVSYGFEFSSLLDVSEFLIPYVSPRPPVVNGLYFWLDAQDPNTIDLVSGRVSVWRDKSGNGFGFAQSNASHRPEYDASLFSGRGGVLFDYATGNGVIADAAASQATGDAFTYFFIGIKTDGLLSAVLQDFQHSILGPMNYNGRYGQGQAAHTMKGIPIDRMCVIGFKNTGDASTAKFFDESGVEIDILNGDVPSFPGTIGFLSFGCKDFGANNGFSSQCAGFLFYKRVLTSDEILSVCSWIRGKYLVSEVAPPDFNMVFSGDSITVGFSANGGLAYAETAMDGLGFSPDRYLISAIGGVKIAEQDANDAINVDPLFDSSLTENLISFFCGTNDLGVNGVNVLDVQADYQTCCENRKAVGWKLIVATMPPRFGSPNPIFEADRQAFNTWLRANYLNFADGLADIASDPVMGPEAAAADTSLYGDGVHPTALGHSLIAPYFQTAIGNIL